MKLLSFKHKGHETYGVVRGDFAIDVAGITQEVDTTLKDATANEQLDPVCGWLRKSA